MVSFKEFRSRVRDFYRFSPQEISGILAAAVITAFIFSFRDWGEEQLDVAKGFLNLLAMGILALLSFAFRLSCQKWYALAEGYKAEFKVWWTGIIISLVVAFISAGKIPLILAGTMMVSFMVKQRLGEFRYGFSYWNNAMISYWGILGNLILALLLAIGHYFAPESYFFSKGLLLNLVMAFLALLPLPQLDGLAILFGSRKIYLAGIFLVLLAAVLLLTGTLPGLLLAVFIGLAYAAVYLAIGSEK